MTTPDDELFWTTDERLAEARALAIKRLGVIRKLEAENERLRAAAEAVVDRHEVRALREAILDLADVLKENTDG